MKFRVFHKFTKEYVDPEYVTINGNGDVRVRFGRFLQEYPNNDSDGIVVEMSTGLFALDGLEIYEGDILYFNSKTEKFAVVYNKVRARFELRLVEFTENGVNVENFDSYYNELSGKCASIALIHCEKTLSQERYNLKTYVKNKSQSHD